MPTYYAAVHLELQNPNPITDLWPSKLKTGTPITPALGNVHINVWMSFCLWDRSMYGRVWTAPSERRIACHRWVCWWAWSPILELQTREQLSHGQTLRLLRGWTPFRTALLCSRASTSIPVLSKLWYGTERRRDRRTDGRTGKICNGAYCKFWPQVSTSQRGYGAPAY